jgi:dTDP-4-amino-4,6-dideoxyglucose formyltransferase
VSVSSTSAKRVLVLTDNLFLCEQFRAIADACGAKFDYACSSQSSPCATLGLPVFSAKSNAAEIKDKVDLVISLHCKQLFPPAFVRAVRCVNVHPGLNPFNRGWFPQVFSIINKLPLGATIHEIDEQLDHGRIIAQEEVRVFPWDTSLSAYERVLEAELRLLRAHLPAIVSGKYSAHPQESEGNLNLKADFSKLCELDLSERRSVGEVIDRLRALTHGDYRNAYFRTADGRKVYVRIQLEPEEQKNLRE